VYRQLVLLLNEKGVSAQTGLPKLELLLPGMLHPENRYAPGSTKLLFTPLAPLEPPICPPFQLLPCCAVCCGAGRSARCGAGRSRFGVGGSSAATAGPTIASAESTLMLEARYRMTRPRFSQIPAATFLKSGVQINGHSL
jgi:hypothetical protein